MITCTLKDWVDVMLIIVLFVVQDQVRYSIISGIPGPCTSGLMKLLVLLVCPQLSLRLARNSLQYVIYI